MRQAWQAPAEAPATPQREEFPPLPTTPSEMEKRVEAQFATLIAAGIRHAVLSAFGCRAFENDPSDIAWVYKQAVERHRASFTVIAFAIFYAGHGEDNYKIFKAFLAPED